MYIYITTSYTTEATTMKYKVYYIIKEYMTFDE